MFSRDLRPLDSEFPELIRAALTLTGDCVLDGEIIASAEGRRFTFHDLRKRPGKTDTFQTDLFTRPKEVSHAALPPVRFVAFDLIYQNGGGVWKP